MIEGICAECERNVMILEKLTDIIQHSREIFKNHPPDKDEPDYKEGNVPAEPPPMSDADFLRMMHIEQLKNDKEE